MPPPIVPAFAQSPYYLKRLADRALVNGINRFVIHTSVHQPFVDDEHMPGMTLGFFGQHFTRNTTWAEQSEAWISYLARASQLLQQGRSIADVAYFYGEGAPNAVPYWKKIDPAPPAGGPCCAWATRCSARRTTPRRRKRRATRWTRSIARTSGRTSTTTRR
jgi:hypothetical protein